ncbi:hypothetical protein B0H13DRAFT_2235584 [Mycena leptocephala]|nr:hypothetical protein B0H13DRAFT_2235584 [Mycena leptocephala]
MFEISARVSYLNAAVALLGDAVSLCGPLHFQRAESLNSYANALYRQFELKGDMDDLEESMKCHQEALELRPGSHPDRSDSLNNLANRTGQLIDLEQSILSPGSHPGRSDSLNNLASALSKRFEQTGQLADLEESIASHLEALELRPGSHPNRSESLNNLASALLMRFKQTGQLTDLEESIAFYQEALELRPGSHPNRSTALNNLAYALATRFEQTGQLADSEESIAFHREALELFPGSHPSRSTSLNNLANALLRQFEADCQLADLKESIAFHEEASTHETSSVIARFNYSRQWARKAASFRHPSAMQAYQYTINLLPRLASLDLNIRQRQEALSRARGLACDACRCAIREDKFDKAVEFLCAGRAVFWAQALQLRTPLDELHSVAPQLAQKLQTISNALEATSAHDGFQTMHDNSRHIRNLEKEVTQRRILNKDWNDTVEAVRKLEGFDGFLLPKSISKLQKAACNGPVVLLNAADSGCDALVVTQKEVKHIPLPDISTKMTRCLGDILRMALSPHGVRSDTLPALLQSIRTNPRLKAVRLPMSGHTPNDLFGAVLGLLWFDVACPIIDALNLKVKQDILPRIWWCPTGPFAFLPIHAAGVYEGDNPESFSDYAISSYTPTLDALLASPPTKVDEPNMLAVIQHEMPELGTIERYVPWLTKLGTKEEPTSVGQVLSLLPGASFDLANPLESALLLGDGDLKVSKIMQNPIQNASLAFLSACETAMGDENVPDEAMHLAATMLFAGFRGVVGTMWTMDDEDGPKVVDVFYNHIFGTGRESHPDSTKAAEALHLAIKKLRTEKKVSFRRWVPFIHLGL